MKEYYKKALNLITHYRMKSIFFIYFKHIFIFISIPILLISVLVAIYCFSIVNKNYSNSVSEKIIPIADYIDECFNEIDKFHFQLESNNTIYNYATDDISKNPLRTAQNASEIYNILISYTAISNYIDNIHVFFCTKNYVISNRESNYISDYHTSDTLKNYSDIVYRVFENSAGDMTLKCFYPIRKNSVTYATVQYDLDLSSILKSNTSDVNIAITSKNGDLIFSTVPTEQISYTLLKETNENPDMLITSGNIDAMSHRFYSKEFSLIYYFNKDNLGYNNMFGIIFICVIAIILLLPLITALYFSLRFYSLIADTVLQFDNHIPVNGVYLNELEFLNNSIFSLIEHDKAIEKNLLISAQTLKKEQSKALQLQITPHFIFNTLNLANAIIMRELKKSNDAEKVIYHLANLISAVLDTQNTIITVEEELDYIKEFFEIEKIRFKHGFDVEFDIDEDVLEKKTIKFILQPIVENAFEHGIKLMNTHGNIVIKAYLEGEKTVFSVTDNGPGISKEELDKINKNLHSESDDYVNSHIGILNVHKRIVLLCGEEYGLNITSIPGETTVKISFALI